MPEARPTHSENGSELVELAERFGAFQQDLMSLVGIDTVLERLTSATVERIPVAACAGITQSDARGLHTRAATSPLVTAVDALQYSLRSGPCVDATRSAPAYVCDDLRVDERWPVFGPRTFAETGVVAMLSIRLYLESSTSEYALNAYSETVGAFGQAEQSVAVLLAMHGALAVAHAEAEARSQNLTIALANSREIGIAVGVLMNSLKVTRVQAFDLLTVASQRHNRKLALIAADVCETGVLPELRGRG